MKVLVVGAGAYVTGRGTGGLGTVLPALAEASRSLPISEVVVCATRDDGGAEVAEAARRVGEALGTSLPVHYRPAAALLDGPDLAGFAAAVVSVPDHLHAEVGRKVLAAGVHCLMVKPLTPTLAEGRELARLAAERGVHAVVELHKRFDEANLVVRRLLRQGRLGRLAYATVEYSQRVSVPTEAFRGWANRTNILQYLGVHYVDLVHFLTGFRPVQALALATRGVLAEAGVDTPDAVHALTRWRRPDGGEFVCQFATGWIDPRTSTAASEQRYLLVGSEGRIECDQKNRGLQVVTGAGGVEAVNPYFSQVLATGGEGERFAGYGYRSIATFLADVVAIRKGEASPKDFHGRRPTFAEALVSTAVIDAANRSLAGGATWESVDAAI